MDSHGCDALVRRYHEATTWGEEDSEAKEEVGRLLEHGRDCSYSNGDRADKEKEVERHVGSRECGSSSGGGHGQGSGWGGPSSNGSHGQGSGWGAPSSNGSASAREMQLASWAQQGTAADCAGHECLGSCEAVDNVHCYLFNNLLLVTNEVTFTLESDTETVEEDIGAEGGLRWSLGRLGDRIAVAALRASVDTFGVEDAEEAPFESTKLKCAVTQEVVRMLIEVPLDSVAPVEAAVAHNCFEIRFTDDDGEQHILLLQAHDEEAFHQWMDTFSSNPSLVVDTEGSVHTESGGSSNGQEGGERDDAPEYERSPDNHELLIWRDEDVHAEWRPQKGDANSTAVLTV